MPKIKLPPNALLAAGVVILAIALGVGIAVASSPGSLGSQTTGNRSSRTPDVSPSPSPSPRPTASPTAGPLGSAATISAGSKYVLVSSAVGSYISTDSGSSWQAVKPPAAATSVVADPSDASHLIAGGLNLSISRDGGKTWAGPRTAPPRTGPVTPLWINSGDGTAWLVVRDSRLIRTRDDGTSWREIVDATNLASPVAVNGAAKDQAFVADGPRILQIDANGDRVTDRGTLPGGTAVQSLAVLAVPAALLAQGSDGSLYVNTTGAGWTKSAAPGAGPVAAVPGKASWIGSMPLSYSTDGGQTWAPAAGLPSNAPVISVAATPDAGKAYVFLLTGEVYASADLGRTWTFAGVPLRS